MKALVAVAAAGTAFAISAGTAGAAVTCTTLVAGTTIEATAGTTQVSVDVAPAGQIRAFDGNIGAGADACGAVDASTANMDSISIQDMTGGDLVVLISHQGGAFAPGLTAEPTGSEIEITVASGGGTDRLEVDGSDNADTFTFGETGGAVVANLNVAAETAGADFDDLNATGIETLLVRGRGGEDDLNATGSSGLGIGPVNLAVLTLEGGNQPDFLRGGSGADTIKGGTQDDNLVGGAGQDNLDGERDLDRLDGGAAADVIEGGTEADRVLYDDRTTAQTVTIGNGAADDGGGEDQSAAGRDNVGVSVEYATMGSGPDSVTGSSVENRINGKVGDDVILGLGGNDTLDGELGNDRLDGGDGADLLRALDGADTDLGGSGKDRLFGGAAADKLFGGPGADQVTGDLGKDVHKGQGGNDVLFARDGKRDKKIDCGAGKAKKESAKVDPKDPKAKSC